ncbi:MAG: DUF378 domain-containing protein [Bacillota bacterium]
MNRTPLDRLALVIVVIGAINWLLVGLFQFDLVAYLFGPGSFLTNTIYSIVGLAGLYSISLLFREAEPVKDRT